MKKLLLLLPLLTSCYFRTCADGGDRCCLLSEVQVGDHIENVEKCLGTPFCISDCEESCEQECSPECPTKNYTYIERMEVAPGVTIEHKYLFVVNTEGVIIDSRRIDDTEDRFFPSQQGYFQQNMNEVID